MSRYETVTMPTNDFFKHLKESAWDRPSAWNVFCALQGLDKRELCMRNYDCLDERLDVTDVDKWNTECHQPPWTEDLKYLEGIFGKGKIPSELTDGEWDT